MIPLFVYTSHLIHGVCLRGMHRRDNQGKQTAARQKIHGRYVCASARVKISMAFRISGIFVPPLYLPYYFPALIKGAATLLLGVS